MWGYLGISSDKGCSRQLTSLIYNDRTRWFVARKSTPPRKYCPVCNGTGLARSGALCAACSGAGEIEALFRTCADMRQTARELREQGREMVHLARSLREQAREMTIQLRARQPLKSKKRKSR